MIARSRVVSARLVPGIRSGVSRGLAVLLTVLATAACAGHVAVQAPPPLPPVPHPPGGGQAVAAVRRAGRLRVAVDLSSPPMAFRDPPAGPRGFDIDLLQLLARALGVRAEIIDTPLAVMRGRFPRGADLAAGALSKGIVAGLASEPYFVDGQTIVWGRTGAGRDLQALRGRRVAVAAASRGEGLAHDAGAATVLRYLPYEAMNAVTAGQADAAIVATSLALGFARRSGLRTTDAGGAGVPLVLVIRPDAPDLADFVSAAIRELKARGGLEQLRRRWRL